MKKSTIPPSPTWTIPPDAHAENCFRSVPKAPPLFPGVRHRVRNDRRQLGWRLRGTFVCGERGRETRRTLPEVGVAARLGRAQTGRHNHQRYTCCQSDHRYRAAGESAALKPIPFSKMLDACKGSKGLMQRFRAACGSLSFPKMYIFVF